VASVCRRGVRAPCHEREHGGEALGLVRRHAEARPHVTGARARARWCSCSGVPRPQRVRGVRAWWRTVQAYTRCRGRNACRYVPRAGSWPWRLRVARRRRAVLVCQAKPALMAGTCKISSKHKDGVSGSKAHCWAATASALVRLAVEVLGTAPRSSVLTASCRLWTDMRPGSELWSAPRDLTAALLVGVVEGRRSHGDRIGKSWMSWLHPGRCSVRPRDALGDDNLTWKAEATADRLLASRNLTRTEGKRMDLGVGSSTTG
jgi:hypothetical protein